MAFVTALLTLPLAPVRSVGWIAELLLDQAYEQELGPGAVRRQLILAQRDLEEGRMTEQEYEEVEEMLINRLHGLRQEIDPDGTVGHHEL